MEKFDNFINIPLQPDNLASYPVRTAILNALTQSLPEFKGEFLDVGCGKMPYRQLIKDKSSITKYVGLDIESALPYDLAVKPDYTWNGLTMPFADNSFDSAMATEVLEHCPDPELVLREINRVLRPGGIFFFTVPFLFNLHEVPYDEYRYTPFSMRRHLANTGFTGEIKALGGWHAAMAQMAGLWIRRGPISERNRKILSWLAVPVIRMLLRKDIKPLYFLEGDMITGLTGVYKKA